MADKEKTREAVFSLDSFKKANEGMIATNDAAYGGLGSRFSSFNNSYRLSREQSIEDIQKIISYGSNIQKASLSRSYFNKDGFYKRILLYYGTLLKYTGLLIPNPANGKTLKDGTISDRYFKAIDFYERMNLPVLANNMVMRTLIDGSYYGVIQAMDKQTFSVLDLPHSWCKSNFKDEQGNDVIEFNVAYFDTIMEESKRLAALSNYPEEISLYYKAWRVTGSTKSSWMFIPTEISIYLQFIDSSPLFLQVIPTTLDYNSSLSREAERELDEIKKIIVQKIPHLNDGSLVFEPIEAQEMHNGAVQMLKASNPNVSVLTSYADIDSIVSRTTGDAASASSVDRMKTNIYSNAGASPQLFAATGNLAVEASLKNDLSLMMILGNKIGLIVTNIINRLYGNTAVSFKYTLLPISYYNQKEFIDESYKMVNTGYSLLLPALAMGLSQRDLGNVKDLENSLLNLSDKLIAPLSSSTLSGSASTEAGRPGIADENKSDKTIKNQSVGGGDEGG